MTEKPRRMSRREAWRAMVKPDSGQRRADAFAREFAADELRRGERVRRAIEELAALREAGGRLH